MLRFGTELFLSLASFSGHSKPFAKVSKQRIPICPYLEKVCISIACIAVWPWYQTTSKSWFLSTWWGDTNYWWDVSSSSKHDRDARAVVSCCLRSPNTTLHHLDYFRKSELIESLWSLSVFIDMQSKNLAPCTKPRGSFNVPYCSWVTMPFPLAQWKPATTATPVCDTPSKLRDRLSIPFSNNVMRCN